MSASGPRPCFRYPLLLLLVALTASAAQAAPRPPADPGLTYQPVKPVPGARVISRAAYREQLQGFWLGQCIANWTGLVTEMDKIGNLGDIRTGPFYTRADWGGPDQPNIWTPGQPSALSPTIDFVFESPGGVWGADDDTDIEYIYQALLHENRTTRLTGEQIRTGWLKHIRVEEENFLWVSNQKAFDLMRAGLVPPATGDPAHNPEFEMIDAQLTTEIFGLYAPGRPDVAVGIARLPIQTTARENAQWIAEFYVRMHALASAADPQLPLGARLRWMADTARREIPADSYTARMYDFVSARHAAGVPWEQARDEVYQRYQVEQADGYAMTAQNKPGNGCFAAGINFASSLISLFYGNGDLVETIKLGTLMGWDSDNPTATWGGLIGFMLGQEGVEQAFGRKFADRFNIHRTRTGFLRDGLDDFPTMALTGVWIVDRAVQEELGGSVDLANDVWLIPAPPAR
ncbi:ADP-ribosylglycohydrolase [Lacunisphaera limnophila]|uniref:ADP-ribosylglycohydrolase n=1 Tax=Lacunisphaera limnophila TaxID=1838286 RepID=A0A1D8ATZ1_9BACT|nr:ADP-ribosylglycohydrolase family protein [Lacunisphaera limnophila]AOS44352.1 ADP-ribosylglycohydrolase [Lacunisphaera limnophila]